ncbi:MAG TPA: hypothetical protein VGI73_04525 [Solirubrobacterales bacterium]|jgi:hypothetical protein
MADSKTKAKRSSGKAKKASGGAKAKAKAKAGSRSTPKAKAKAGAKSSTSKAKAPQKVAKVAEAAKELPGGAAANAALAGKAALDGTQAAGKAVGLAVTKARVPLVAGAGLAAGAAGGLALMRRRNGHHHRGHLDLDLDLASVAKRVGSFGEELGRVANAVEKAAGSKK